MVGLKNNQREDQQAKRTGVEGQEVDLETQQCGAEGQEVRQDAGRVAQDSREEGRDCTQKPRQEQGWTGEPGQE